MVFSNNFIFSPSVTVILPSAFIKSGYVNLPLPSPRIFFISFQPSALLEIFTFFNFFSHWMPLSIFISFSISFFNLFNFLFNAISLVLINSRLSFLFSLILLTIFGGKPEFLFLILVVEMFAFETVKIIFCGFSAA